MNDKVLSIYVMQFDSEMRSLDAFATPAPVEPGTLRPRSVLYERRGMHVVVC